VILAPLLELGNGQAYLVSEFPDCGVFALAAEALIGRKRKNDKGSAGYEQILI
jgi:hypothetical protein